LSIVAVAAALTGARIVAMATMRVYILELAGDTSGQDKILRKIKDYWFPHQNQGFDRGFINFG
jgi:hypothetical protein